MRTADALYWAYQSINGIDFSDGSLAFNVIDEIGPPGQFLEHQHTQKHLRKNLGLPVAFDCDVEHLSCQGSKDYTTKSRKLPRKWSL